MNLKNFELRGDALSQMQEATENNSHQLAHDIAREAQDLIDMDFLGFIERMERNPQAVRALFGTEDGARLDEMVKAFSGLSDVCMALDAIRPSQYNKKALAAEEAYEAEVRKM